MVGVGHTNTVFSDFTQRSLPPLTSVMWVTEERLSFGDTQRAPDLFQSLKKRGREYSFPAS